MEARFKSIANIFTGFITATARGFQELSRRTYIIGLPVIATGIMVVSIFTGAPFFLTGVGMMLFWALTVTDYID